MATKGRTIAKAARPKAPNQQDAENAAATARTIVRPSVNAAAVVSQYAKETYGELDMDALVSCLSAGMDDLASGDMRRAEAMLYGQAHALQALFVNMARRAPKQDLMCHWDAYMRVALKAQNQCRMTLETLATIKNPPVVFARQANINNGGQQQVNNGTDGAAPHASRAPAQRAPGRAPAANSSIENTELLEASNGERLDTRTAGTASGADPQVETVEAVHRPADGRGQGPHGSQR